MNHTYVRAFTLIELMIVVAIIGLLAAIAIPNFMQAIEKSRRIACQANLKQIQAAKLEWAVDFRKSSTDAPSEQELFGPGKYLQVKPTCGSGGTYSIHSIESAATCNIASHTL